MGTCFDSVTKQSCAQVLFCYAHETVRLLTITNTAHTATGNVSSFFNNSLHLYFCKHNFFLDKQQSNIIFSIFLISTDKHLFHLQLGSLTSNIISSKTAKVTLSFLRSLVKLNLSYNQIEDLSGIKSCAGPSYSLTHLDLHGNKLASVAHVSQCLCRVNNLKHLTLSLDGSGNPLCHKPGLYFY